MKIIKISVAILSFFLYMPTIQSLQKPIQPTAQALALSYLQQNLKNSQFNLQNALMRKHSIKSIITNILNTVTQTYPSFKTIISYKQALTKIGNYIFSVAAIKKIDLNSPEHEDYGDKIYNELQEALAKVYAAPVPMVSKIIKAQSSNPLIRFIGDDLKKNATHFRNALEMRQSIKPILNNIFTNTIRAYPQYKNIIKDLDEIKLVISDYLYPIAVAKNIDLDNMDADYGTLLIKDINNAIAESFLSTMSMQQPIQQRVKPQTTNKTALVLQQILKNNQLTLQVAIGNKQSIKTLLQALLRNFTKLVPNYKSNISEKEALNIIGDYIQVIARAKKIDFEQRDRNYGNQLIIEINDAIEQIYP